MKRREFLMTLAANVAGLTLGGVNHVARGKGAASYIKRSEIKDKVIVLGIDGMDPHLLVRFVREGIMPNFERLMEKGSFMPLGTSLPPQSPVAWSNFITGMNPGGHGIFDFIHRDPRTFAPYLSTTRMQHPSKKLTIGDWVIPLRGGEVGLLRKGRAFWTILEDHNIQATVFKMPANFPPVKGNSRTISGLGTPDLLGTYGTFSFYTDLPPENADQFTGGKVYPIKLQHNKFTAKLVGLKNSFRRDGNDAEVAFAVYRDPSNPVAKIVLQNQEILLNEGEWSSWIRVRFEMLPHLHDLSGICRFYLQEVHPHFRLYVTPINIDPCDPALPICTPDNYSRELCKMWGPFYTQGFPEDTKALSNGIFTDEEYLTQAQMVLVERLHLFEAPPQNLYWHLSLKA